MNKKVNKKEIKLLAEQHYFGGKVLTTEEYGILKGSKYHSIVKPIDEFTQLVEDVITGEAGRRKICRRSRRYNFAAGLDKRSLKDLVDEIEEKFDLDINNSSPSKYRKVEIESFKRFIQEYTDRNIFDDNTKSYITGLLDPKSTVYSILDSLYMRTY
jgi:hypothetical protein